MSRFDIDESATTTSATTTSGNAGAYTKPLGYSSKSLPVLVDDFGRRAQEALSHTQTGRKNQKERRRKTKLMTMI